MVEEVWRLIICLFSCLSMAILELVSRVSISIHDLGPSRDWSPTFQCLPLSRLVSEVLVIDLGLIHGIRHVTLADTVHLVVKLGGGSPRLCLSLIQWFDRSNLKLLLLFDLTLDFFSPGVLSLCWGSLGRVS